MQEEAQLIERDEKKEWKDATIEEYQSTIKNDVWDVVPRTEGESVESSNWIYKIKHVVDGNIENYKENFLVSLKKIELTMERRLIH